MVPENSFFYAASTEKPCRADEVITGPEQVLDQLWLAGRQ